jgi:ribosomal protein S27AE
VSYYSLATEKSVIIVIKLAQDCSNCTYYSLATEKSVLIVIKLAQDSSNCTYYSLAHTILLISVENVIAI